MLTNKILSFLRNLKKQLKSRKGFSLIELMVVVAIIAILSTIAIPAYQNFQARARQKEGMSMLGSYFVAAQAAKVEHGGYVGNFTAIGFSPAGTLKYRLKAKDNTAISGLFGAGGTLTGPNDTACITTEAPTTNCKQQTVTWTELAGAKQSKVGAIAPVSAPVVNSNDFRVFASGVINLAAPQVDEWGMNEQKRMLNTKDGLADNAKGANDQTW